jgi:uncharacterized protein YbjT (DUF2867 family)
MSKIKLIGITGATGAVGSLVAELLAKKGISQRLLVRDLDRAPNIDAAETVQFDGYRHQSSMTQALQGVHTLFLVSGHFSDDRVKDHQTAVDSAIAADVKRIVYLSFLNAAPAATFIAAQEHYHTEAYIRQCGLPFTFVRCGLYADHAPRYFGADGVMRGPAGDGRVSYVTRADIVEAVVVVLTEEGHDNQTYSLTGSEALALDEVAHILTQATGQTCTFYNETMEEARKSRSGYDVSGEVVEVWISTYLAMANGELSTITNDVEQLTGHPPRTLRDFVEKHPESYAHIVSGDITNNFES